MEEARGEKVLSPPLTINKEKKTLFLKTVCCDHLHGLIQNKLN